MIVYSKTCVKLPLSKRPQIGFYEQLLLMEVKSIAECSKGLPFVIKIIVLSIFEWVFDTGFTVYWICLH